MVSKIAAVRKVLSIVIGCSIAIAVLAEDGQLDTIVVTGRPIAEPISEIAGSVGVVDHETLDLVQHTHVNESADRVSGVWISRGNGQEHLTAIRSPVFTGPGSCGEFVVLEDGIPTRPAGFCNANQLFEINSEQADRIEIFKGPNSAVYGGNAVHGVINVVSPMLTEQEKSSVMLDAGPHDYAREFFSYSDGKNIMVNMHNDHDGGYIDDSGFNQQKLNVKYVDNRENYRVENFIEMTNLNQDTAGYLVGSDAYKDDQLRTTNSTPGAYRDAQSVHGYQRYIVNQGDGKEFQITPYANTSQMEFTQSYIPTAPLEKNGQVSVGVNGRFSYPLFNIPSDILSMNSGFNIETARAYVDEFQSKATAPGGYVQGQHYDFDVLMNSLSLSTEAEYHFLPRVKLIAGGRYDDQFYNYDTKTPANTVGRYTRLADRNDKFGNWGFNLGAIWDWAEDHQLYLNGSSGFRAPQVAELYRLEGGVPANSVQSEKITNIELGLRGHFKPVYGDNLSYEFAVFDMFKDHVILKDNNKQYLGDGKTSHEGVELSLDYRFLQTVYIKTAMTYAEHRYEHIGGQLQYSPNVNLNGNMIDTAPRYFGSAQLGNQFYWGLVELEVKKMGPYYLNPENTLEYEGHTLLNLRAEWNIAPSWKIGANLLNVMNVDYAERADATPLSSAPRYFVGEPRSLYASIEKIF